MPFTKERFGLFFSEPLSAQDEANLRASKVKLVMIPLPFADAATMRLIASVGARAVLRVPESDYYDDFAPSRIKNQTLAAMQNGPVEALMVGVEPDGEYILSYDSDDFGQAHAYE